MSSCHVVTPTSGSAQNVYHLGSHVVTKRTCWVMSLMKLCILDFNSYPRFIPDTACIFIRCCACAVLENAQYNILYATNVSDRYVEEESQNYIQTHKITRCLLYFVFSIWPGSFIYCSIACNLQYHPGKIIALTVSVTVSTMQNPFFRTLTTASQWASCEYFAHQGQIWVISFAKPAVVMLQQFPFASVFNSRFFVASKSECSVSDQDDEDHSFILYRNQNICDGLSHTHRSCTFNESSIYNGVDTWSGSDWPPHYTIGKVQGVFIYIFSCSFTLGLYGWQKDRFFLHIHFLNALLGKCLCM